MGLPEELWVACHGVAAEARHNLSGQGLRMRRFPLQELGDVADDSSEGWREMSREAFFRHGEKEPTVRVRAKVGIAIAVTAHLQ